MPPEKTGLRRAGGKYNESKLMRPSVSVERCLLLLDVSNGPALGALEPGS